MNPLYRIRHSECYQNTANSRPFFEGWYYKIEDRSGRHILSVIPGVSRRDKGGPVRPFIQGIAGDRSFFIPFAPGDFTYRQRPFCIEIGPNRFSLDDMHLALSDRINLTGTLRFLDSTPLKTSLLSPGIMGPLSYIPFMECRHGLLCLDAKVSGTLLLQDQALSFSNGRAYIEKDWGHSFPQAYLWVQSNRFSTAGVSFVCAAATIPFLGHHITGVFAVLHTPDRQYRIATYTGGRLIDLQQTHKGIFLHLVSPRYRLAATVDASPGITLKAPARGGMSRTVSESLHASVHVTFTSRRGRVLFQDTGRNAGLEASEPLPYPL